MTVRTPAVDPAVARRTVRYVEHAMGMPISLALRGRRTDDEKAHTAWAQVSNTDQIDRHTAGPPATPQRATENPKGKS